MQNDGNNVAVSRGSLYHVRLPFAVGGGTEYIALALSEANADGLVDFALLDGAGNVDAKRCLRLPASVAAGAAGNGQLQLEAVLRERTVDAARQHYAVKHHKHSANASQDGGAHSGPIPYAGRVFDGDDVANLVHASLDFWLTAGRFTAQFEKDMAKYLGLRACLLTNSGSSANLLAFSALTSPLLKDRRLQKGDEVISVAAGFPSTITPIIQNGCVPVFVDVELPYYNIDCSQLEAALSPRTRAVMLAHTLGNPFDLETIRAFCDKHKLWLIEDNCDALGSEYTINGETKLTGTIGHLGTSSFYPPHHMTMGEGGAVYTNDPLLKRIVASFRDWGRDCWCDPGKDNTCGTRFDWSLGELPQGYDHKYIYSHFGYNLKVTDMQAAVGCTQLRKLPSFVAARRKNWEYLRAELDDLQDVMILPEPAPNSRPSWFGFLLTIRPESGLRRDAVVRHLESKSIQTRMLFAGNFLRHPAFDDLRGDNTAYRVVGDLPVTETIMNHTFWVGVYPGMTEAMLSIMVTELKAACRSGVNR